MVVSMTYVFYAGTQCYGSETGTSEIFCLSGTEAGTGIKVGTGTTTNHYDSTALLVSQFLGFLVSYLLERKLPMASESDAFVLSGMKKITNC